MPPSADVPAERWLVRVTGTVQGVGFRPFVYRTATALGLSGHVSNDGAGVLIEAEGTREALADLCRRLWNEAPPLAKVTAVETLPLHALEGHAGFEVLASRDGRRPDVPVSIDVAPCTACLAELGDPGDRRHRHPFINCTDCGPRYTIVRRVPYDRPCTTMAAFAMCDACRREYEDPADRRFHAQPNACPECGPQLALLDPTGGLLATGDDALHATTARLVSHGIVAVKGVGGYHLAADATSERAVRELRRRKARDDKPFALLVGSVEEARRLCELGGDAEAALVSPRRPIVLARRREDAPVSGFVAPGLPELGVMLPPSPLHHLLAESVGRPLVLTSGNVSDEPIAYEDDDALTRIGALVDAFLTHDRPIHIRCDDSVVRVGDVLDVQVLRRSRGYAPEPIRLPQATERHLLAVGAELKSTIAVAKGASVVPSHHLGDLEHWAAYRSFLEAVQHVCHLLGVDPEVVAHDLHPDYLSTKFAAELDLPAVPVQHHHAHVASCLVDHGRSDTVLGVAFDGLGWGADGSLWGGEFLVADLRGYERCGRLRAAPLPGGAAAIREPWRMALSWVDVACGREVAGKEGVRLDDRSAELLPVLDSPRNLVTTSIGRLFDAVAALLGVRRRVTYEGQAAIELEAVARRSTGRPPALAPPTVGASDSSTELVLDPSPLIAALIEARERGVAIEMLAAAFHDELAAGAAAVATQLAGAQGLDTVALTGGVFQNALLTSLLRDRLERAGLNVLVHRQVPPNDGGVSIGQVAVAATRSSST